MAENVTFGKDSIQIPYRRFLADSAAGFVLVGLLVLAYYARPAGAWHLNVSTETQVFLLVLLFLLATPIGFTANAISWVLLGNAVAAVESLCFRLSQSDTSVFVTWHVSEARQTRKLTEYFGIDADTFSTTGSLFRDLMESDTLAKFAPPSNARELMIFLRNIALYLLVGSVIVVTVTSQRLPPPVAAAIATAAALILLLRQPQRVPGVSRMRKFAVPALRAAALISACLLFWSSSAKMGVLLLLAAVISAVLVAGIVDYYHYSYVLLHTYFACRALGIEWKASSADRVIALLNAGTGLFSAAAHAPRSGGEQLLEYAYCPHCGRQRS